MKKSDIKNRIQEIDNRLSELPTICEREQRELTEAETREMTQLAAERSDLQRQLADIERGETREVPMDKSQKFSLIASIRSIANG
jgi:flagellar biosynthesis/type III secretory pathway chaperone